MSPHLSIAGQVGENVLRCVTGVGLPVKEQCPRASENFVICAVTADVEGSRVNWVWVAYSTGQVGAVE
jgi:hypothetical protein